MAARATTKRDAKAAAMIASQAAVKAAADREAERAGATGQKADGVSILSPISLLTFMLYYKVDQVGCFYRPLEEYCSSQNSFASR